MPLKMLSFIVLFLLGRAASLTIYQMCWSNGLSGNFARPGALFTLLRRPLPWVIHLAVASPMIGLSWRDWPLLQGFAMMGAGLLALGAVGRFGSAELGRFFFADRLLAVVLAIGVGFSPAFLYPCLVACCCLQYTVASWRLGPGYSNLLGFEFIRASLCVMTACLAAFGWLKHLGVAWHDFENLTLAVLVGYQASTYVNHSLAKSALGPKWHSWIRQNRAECLVGNAWLRGWTAGRNSGTVLKQMKWIGDRRVRICAAVWILESAWLFILADSRFALALVTATVLLHLVVIALTGLAAYQYVVNHLYLLFMIAFCDSSGVFRYEYLAAGCVVMPVAAIWVGCIRWRIFENRRQSGTTGLAGKFADAADHLMAWWDTPFMRMYSYTIETRSGARFALPVPKLSPHDTSLTDLHTHLMILGLHGDLDPAIAADRATARTGVWGLTVHRKDRDFLYLLMDENKSGVPDALRVNSKSAPWVIDVDGRAPAAALPLRDLFQGINRTLHMSWFRHILRWPHFPGEDLVADICPLVEPRLEPFRFDDAIATVTLWRIKTFCNGREMMLVENQAVGCIHLEEIESPA